MSRPRVLVCAYSANPAAQSEPLNGYKFARELHRIADVKVIAHERDREDLSRSELAGDILYAGSATSANTLRRLGQRLFGRERWHLLNALESLDYARFEADCLRLARRLRHTFPFDLIHRVTPTSIRFPTLLWRLGVPLVSGPHNGGMSWPAGFKSLAAVEGSAERLRVVAGPLHALARDFERNALLIVANSHCRMVIPRRHWSRVREMSENGVDEVQPQGAHAGDATRLLYVGRLIPCKCVDVAIRALARLPQAVSLTVVGDGAERKALAALARELDVAARVEFVGWVRQSQTGEYYRRAGVFVFPSVRDGGGAVVLEAMSWGLPAVVARWGGPAQFVGADCGVALPVEGPRQLEDGIVQALRGLLDDPTRGREIGHRAASRIAEEYLWPKKAERLLRLYDEVLN